MEEKFSVTQLEISCKDLPVEWTKQKTEYQDLKIKHKNWATQSLNTEKLNTGKEQV